VLLPLAYSESVFGSWEGAFISLLSDTGPAKDYRVEKKQSGHTERGKRRKTSARNRRENKHEGLGVPDRAQRVKAGSVDGDHWPQQSCAGCWGPQLCHAWGLWGVMPAPTSLAGSSPHLPSGCWQDGRSRWPQGAPGLSDRLPLQLAARAGGEAGVAAVPCPAPHVSSQGHLPLALLRSACVLVSLPVASPLNSVAWPEPAACSPNLCKPLVLPPAASTPR